MEKSIKIFFNFNIDYLSLDFYTFYMKKIFYLITISFILVTASMNLAEAEVFSNDKIDFEKLQNAQKIILDLQKDAEIQIEKGYGPFVAAIYDKDGNLIVKTANSVLSEKCSSNHAEMNAIKEAERILGTHDLAPYNLSIYVTAEPCMMCLGGIMWSGIKNVYFGVPSKQVEKITGFDEGFKLHWLKEFKKRGIIVYGNIEPEAGEKVLDSYVKSGKKVYKPSRD